ncbi:GSCFA domain-containing protein [Psychroserpens ponticola]|uniref:GSCFA domain-containing protein n=1 Tax=Psychroserpens ponticola TaxID=2932268 RepID=A0ABY7RV09_9FLAO|nr:GSCFA domain-containing protein [Psychroserpens ponticola]WCO00974.1 GSCFA domain-containing protein [Psychroserpens ponticola]
MELQTKLLLSSQQHHQIDYNSKIGLFGSCFSEHIAEKFNYYKFQKFDNPFGILFHPFAIEKLIVNAINEKQYTENDVFFYNEQWHCFDAHSKLSRTSKEDLLQVLNAQIHTTSEFLKNASHIIITLGTAWTYRLIETDNHVANCHKVPQKKFLKELLPVASIAESLEAIISLIKSINSKVSILFTVSPVRHIKDGFVENTQSKSHLISAIHQIVEPRKQLFYFPSYEIMLDELRDYRFYKEDMLHPNAVAINYIWEHFFKVWISKDANQTMQDIEYIQKGLSHRPSNPNSEAHQLFLQKLHDKQVLLQSTFSHIQF